MTDNEKMPQDIADPDCNRPNETPLAKMESLVCEALVREIGRADRWSAVQETWEALLHVRHMADAMHREAAMFDKSDGRMLRKAR